MKNEGNKFVYYVLDEGGKKIYTDIHGNPLKEKEPQKAEKTFEEISAEADAEEKSQKWINGETSQPTDPYNGPRLWMSEKFPRETYLTLWNASSKLSSDYGVHISVIEPGLLGLGQAKIAAYTKEGLLIGEVRTSAYNAESINEGINTLASMIDGTFVKPERNSTVGATMAEREKTGVIGAVTGKIKSLYGASRETMGGFLSSWISKNEQMEELINKQNDPVEQAVRTRAREMALDDLREQNEIPGNIHMSDEDLIREMNNPQSSISRWPNQFMDIARKELGY